MNKENVIVLLSGGLNSAVVVALALKQGYEVLALSIHYGQCHGRDLRSAQLLVDHYSIREYFVSSLDVHLWSRSALANSQKMRSMPAPSQDKQCSDSYLPNRNLIFLSLALSLAEARGARRIFMGTNHSDDGHSHASNAAIESLNTMLERSSHRGTLAVAHPSSLIEVPLRDYTKLDVMKLAIELDVPIDLTWSCSQALAVPCGSCSACRNRDQALLAVGLPHLVTPYHTFQTSS